MTNAIRKLLTDLEMPGDCISELCNIYDRIGTTEAFGRALKYFFSENPTKEEGAALLAAAAQQTGTHPYQFDGVVVLAAYVRLKTVYEGLKLPEEMYRGACTDIRCKLWECKRTYGIWGTFVTHWYYRFFAPSRFALGRFQFETDVLKGSGAEPVTIDGIPNVGSLTVKPGDAVVRIHIPSTGEPMSDAARMDAYKRAYAFYRDTFGSIIPFSCNSWLLYEKQREFLPESSNVLKFMGDFAMVANTEQQTFKDLWRLFNVPNDTPYEDLPESNSLFRAYKQHLLRGGKTGSGIGLFFFDGERIYNHKKMR